MKVKYRSVLFVALLLAAGSVIAGAGAGAGSADSGALLKPELIKAEPFRDAKTVSTLNAGDCVEILGAQGGWYQIKSARGNGWVRMLSVRRGEARRGKSEAASVINLVSGRSGTGAVVATTGIRSLSAGELKAAHFSDTEISKLESMTVTADEARRFAGECSLMAQRVEYLPAPVATK